LQSLWLDRESLPPTDAFVPGSAYDTVVVGAGLTGLCTASLLAAAGQSVLVLEARHLAAVTTGNTTAKLSALHGSQVSNIAAHNSEQVARAYVEANVEGREWMLRYCEDHAVPFQRRDAWTYATTQEGADKVQREYDACRQAGLEVSLETETELPFITLDAIRLADQAQFDPLDVVQSLAAEVQAHGGLVVEHISVTDVSTASDGVEVSTVAGPVHADRVVLATGTPILAEGAHFARLAPLRSYAMAFTVPGPIPQGMYLSLDQPTRSLRTAPSTQGEQLLVGGNGHPVGRESSPRARLRELQDWTEEHFPGAVRTHAWSAQDYQSLDYAPDVGPIVPGDEHVFVATGFNKWGMTNAVAASLALSGLLLGGQMHWAETLYRRPVTLADAPEAIKLNVGVGAQLAKDWLGQALRGAPEHPPAEGEGGVHRDGLRPVAVCTVDGVTSRVSGVCTHLGGVLAWNDAEQSWDCPLHGSRFTHDGKRLEGPALRDLDPVVDDSPAR